MKPTRRPCRILTPKLAGRTITCDIQMFGRIKKFFEEKRVELRHVNWPTRREAVRLTGAVIGISLAIALFLGFFDYILIGILKSFVL